MPWMTIPIATVIAGGAAGAASVYASNKASGANKKALEAQERADERAIAIEKEERDYDRQIDVERYNRNEARLDRLERLDQERNAASEARATRDENFARTKWNANAEYRATGKAALGELAKIAGLSVGDPNAEKTAMVPDAAPSSVPFTNSIPTPAPKPAVSIGDTRSMENPGPSLPTPGDDGLVELRMSPDAYQSLAAQWSPRPSTRRPIGALVPGGGR